MRLEEESFRIFFPCVDSEIIEQYYNKEFFSDNFLSNDILM